MEEKTNDYVNLKNAARPQAPSSFLEKWIVPAFFLGVAIFTVADLISDAQEAFSLPHFLIEIIIACLSLAGSTYFVMKHQSALQSWKKEIQKAKSLQAEASQWQEKHQRLLKNLNDAISEQLNNWELTPSEKDVALFLIKGFSVSEIAEFRKTSEKTIKLQASAVYSKSGLGGRAELSGFFLEEVLN